MDLSISGIRKSMLKAVSRTVDMMPGKKKIIERKNPEIAEIQRLTRKYMKQAKGDIFLAAELGYKGDPVFKLRIGKFDPSGDNGYYPRTGQGK